MATVRLAHFDSLNVLAVSSLFFLSAAVIFVTDRNELLRRNIEKTSTKRPPSKE
jgi:hypothetical protein